MLSLFVEARTASDAEREKAALASLNNLGVARSVHRGYVLGFLVSREIKLRATTVPYVL